MIPFLHWTDAADGLRVLYAGNLPHPIARGTRRASGLWRLAILLPGVDRTVLAWAAGRAQAEHLVTESARGWFAAVSA